MTIKIKRTIQGREYTFTFTNSKKVWKSITSSSDAGGEYYGPKDEVNIWLSEYYFRDEVGFYWKRIEKKLIHEFGHLAEDILTGSIEPEEVVASAFEHTIYIFPMFLDIIKELKEKIKQKEQINAK